MEVSIIIPVYKVEAYIQECLESVSNQTMTEGVECIIVDDCGGDRSMEIAERFMSSYHGDISFIIIKHEKNKGLSAARNSALKICRGEYVYFLDSDDYITPDCIESLWNLTIKYPCVDIVQSYYYREGQNPDDPPQYGCSCYSNNRAKIRTDLCKFRITDAACNRLVRTDFIKRNGIYFQVGYTQEDTIWSFDLQKYIQSIVFCNKYTYYYRCTPNSIMTSLTKDKVAIDFSKVHNLALEKLNGRKPDTCEVYYFLHLANRVNNANRLICEAQLPTMKSKLFRGLVKIYDRRRYGKFLFERVLAELSLRVLCPILSKVGLITHF